MAPQHLLRSVLVHRHLLLQFTRRDLTERYKGSVAGLAWSLVMPLVMLGVYIFVFGVVFSPTRGAPVASGDSSLLEAGLLLFSGMIVHGLLSESLVRAPQAVLSQPAYVKRIVFPLELLPLTVAASAYVQFLISWSVLVAVALLWPSAAAPGLAVVLGPLVVVPLLLMSTGVALALSALTVYLRDLSQVTPLLATILMFLSPVFYPVERLPEALQPWMALNPLTVPIESLRAVTMHGTAPDPAAFGLHLLVSMGVLWAGWFVFQATRRGFADVL